MPNYTGLSPVDALNLYGQTRRDISSKFAPGTPIDPSYENDFTAINLQQQNPEAWKLLKTGGQAYKDPTSGKTVQDVFSPDQGWKPQEVKSYWSHPESWVQAIAGGALGGLAAPGMLAGALGHGATGSGLVNAGISGAINTGQQLAAGNKLTPWSALNFTGMLPGGSIGSAVTKNPLAQKAINAGANAGINAARGGSFNPAQIATSFTPDLARNITSNPLAQRAITAGVNQGLSFMPAMPPSRPPSQNPGVPQQPTGIGPTQGFGAGLNAGNWGGFGGASGGYSRMNPFGTGDVSQMLNSGMREARANQPFRMGNPAIYGPPDSSGNAPLQQAALPPIFSTVGQGGMQPFRSYFGNGGGGQGMGMFSGQMGGWGQQADTAPPSTPQWGQMTGQQDPSSMLGQMGQMGMLAQQAGGGIGPRGMPWDYAPQRRFRPMMQMQQDQAPQDGQ